MTDTTHTAVQSLEDASRLLDPAAIIMNHFTDALEQEASYAAKHPAVAAHFASRVFDNFVPVFNSLCTAMFNSRDSVLAAEQAMYSCNTEGVK